MIRTNPYYSRLQSSYLFSQIAKRVAAFQQEYPERELIRMGIGDVTRPLTPGVIRAMHAAVDDLSAEETFRGYAPDLGYAFLREAIARVDFQERGCGISPDEIFVSDGAKCDSANIQEIFDADCRIAVCDPVYPVYVDSNVMAAPCGGGITPACWRRGR